MRSSRSVAGAVVLVLLAGSVALAATACPSAQYTVVGRPLGKGAARSTTVEIGSRIGLGSLCPLGTGGRIRITRGGATRVRHRWKTCAALRGVRLKAKVVDDCTRVIAQVRARGYHRRFQAVRSDCGDGILDATPPATPYAPTKESLATHPLPKWFDDAKFGIMVHWGIFTIPAWAELVLDPGEWLCCGKLLDPPDFGVGSPGTELEFAL